MLHDKSESEQCIALLQESICILHFLETVDSDLTSKKGYISLGAQDRVRRACSLRRIYEEDMVPLKVKTWFQKVVCNLLHTLVFFSHIYMILLAGSWMKL